MTQEKRIWNFFTETKQQETPTAPAYKDWKVCFRRIEHRNYTGMGTSESVEWRKVLYSGQCVQAGDKCLYETSAGWIEKTSLLFPEKCA